MGMIMTNTQQPESNCRIWMWMHEGHLYKASYNQQTCTLKIEDEQGNLLMTHIGITPKQLQALEERFLKHKGTKLGSSASNSC